MKSAIQLIREADRGQLMQDFEQALEDIVAAIETHGGSGDITIKLKVKKKGDAYLVASELKSSAPQPPRVEALFFFDSQEGELTRKDPRQPTIPSVVAADEVNRRRHTQQE